MNARPAHLVILAVLEAAIGVALVVRVGLGLAELGQQAHLLWFAATVVLAGVPVALYVVRSSLLRARPAEPGEDPEALQRQTLFFSLALMIPPAAIALAGPAIVERLLGAR